MEDTQLSFFRENVDFTSERERLVKEFNQRKKDAAANKAKGVAQWMGAGYSPRPLPQAPKVDLQKAIPVKEKAVRNKAEEVCT